MLKLALIVEVRGAADAARLIGRILNRPDQGLPLSPPIRYVISLQ
jgi:hypothetical protein